MGEDALSKDAEMAKQAYKRVQLPKSTRLRKANPKTATLIKPIDPERLSQAIQYLKEHPKRLRPPGGAGHE